MQHGLDDAGRFDPATRLIRCSLAFGELEYLSLRWMQRGWSVVDRETALGVLADSWCHLLVDDGSAADAGVRDAAGDRRPHRERRPPTATAAL